MFGCKSEAEFISKTPADLSSKYQPDGSLSSVKAREMMATAMEKGAHYFEWTHRRVDGSEFPSSVLLTKLNIEGNAVLQATIRDITADRKMEDELKKKVRDLETFYKVTMDREKRVIELKKEIEWLKEELKDRKT